jgi:flavin reductase (DIM6/NTAB) family NADH-FMN oxidoreductase RutF
LFESGGGDDESVHPLRIRFQEVGVREAFAPILIKEPPNIATLQLCEEAGTDLGQWLTRDRAIKQMKSMDSDLDKALGRLSGGLYIITARKGDASSAMLASWVSQASMKPPGFTIAVAKDRAIESFMHVGDRFVLNILEEGNYQTLMRHFLKRFPPGGDRFAGIRTYPASNGSPILGDALAYLECEVISRMECSDHWVVYSQVESGRISKVDGLTAVHHRKVGNHY